MGEFDKKKNVPKPKDDELEEDFPADEPELDEEDNETPQLVEIEGMEKLTDSIKQGWGNLIRLFQDLKRHLFRVEVTNHPDVQKVELTNPVDNTALLVQLREIMLKIANKEEVDNSEALLDALRPLQYMTNDPTRPLSVRLSNGDAFYKALGGFAGSFNFDNSGALIMAVEKKNSATSTAITVAATSTAVLSANPSRIEAIIVNDSDEDIYLKYGTGAALNSGLRLNARGGSVVEKHYTGAITGICASGSKVLTVTEV